MKKEIYYFTGTGNSLQISKEIAKNLGDTQLISISKIRGKKQVATEADIVGIVYPIYFMNEPDIVSDFLYRLKAEKSYIFLVCNCGANYGGSLKVAVDKLSMSGNTVSSAFNMYMPDNSISFPTPLEQHPEMLNSMIGRAEEIAEAVKNKEVHMPDGSKVASVFGKAVMKNICKGILGFDKIDADKEKCISCSICQKVCPVDNIKNADQFPEWGNDCQMCFSCIHYCPQKAVTFKRQNKVKEYQYTNPNISISEMMNR